MLASNEKTIKKRKITQNNAMELKMRRPETIKEEPKE